MSSIELALKGQKKAVLSDVQSAVSIANKGAELAKNYTPNFAKKGLNVAKNFGEWGLGKVTNSKLGRFASANVDALSDKQRTGSALSFNPKKIMARLGGIKTISDLTSSDKISQVMIIIIALLFFIIFLFAFNKINLDKKNCTKIGKIFSKFPFINSINPDNPIFKNRLRDYYIKTAYNCCSSGNFKNDFVNLCALKNCIKQGVRCLDFEIYSVENVPVIAISSTDSFNVKESYNSIPFAKAMEVISTYAFSGDNCPNPDDPLILHFRIKSNSKEIQSAMANALYNTLEDRLLGPEFSYENNGRNIGAFPIVNLMRKVVLIVDKTNPIFTDTLLNEYVNLASNSAFMRGLRFKDVEFTPDKDELIFFNQQNMTICLPDLSARNKNYSSALAMTYGCQMIAMNFQNFDRNLQFYTQYFDDAGSAFVQRPDRFRYIPTFIPIPPPQDPSVSYGTETTNPLGPNGPSNLDMNITTDYGKGSSSGAGKSLCGNNDGRFVSGLSIECINSLFAEYGNCKTAFTRSTDPNEKKSLKYTNKRGNKNAGWEIDMTLRELKEYIKSWFSKDSCTKYGGTST